MNIVRMSRLVLALACCGLAAATNDALAQGYPVKPVRVVVPYFGKVWDIPNSRHGGNVHFTHLLTPGNQPGLIP